MQIIDAPNPFHPANLEADLCHRVTISLRKRQEGPVGLGFGLNPIDITNLAFGEDYLQSVRQGQIEMLRGPLNGQSAVNATRFADFFNALDTQKVFNTIRPPFTETSIREFISEKLTQYMCSLDRLSRGDHTTEDCERLLPEQIKVWSALEEINQRKVQV